MYPVISNHIIGWYTSHHNKNGVHHNPHGSVRMALHSVLNMTKARLGREGIPPFVFFLHIEKSPFLVCLEIVCLKSRSNDRSDPYSQSPIDLMVNHQLLMTCYLWLTENLGWFLKRWISHAPTHTTHEWSLFVPYSWHSSSKSSSLQAP